MYGQLWRLEQLVFVNQEWKPFIELWTCFKDKLNAAAESMTKWERMKEKFTVVELFSFA